MSRELVCAGLTTVDVIQYCAQWPAWGTKQRADGALVDVGGPAANAAITAALLGARVRLVTAVGEGPLAVFASARLAQYGVEVIDAADPGASLPVSSIWVNTINGERTVLSTNRAETSAIDPETAVGERAVLLVDGHYPEIGAACAAQARARGVPVVLDGGSWKPAMEQLLPLSSVAILSAAFRIPGSGALDPASIPRAVQARWGTPCVAMTQGPEDVLWRDGGRDGRTQVPPVDAIDTLGAGDVLHGAYCAYRFIAEHDHETALRQAVMIASASCEHRGTREGVVRHAGTAG